MVVFAASEEAFNNGIAEVTRSLQASRTTPLRWIPLSVVSWKGKLSSMVKAVEETYQGEKDPQKAFKHICQTDFCLP